MKMEVSKTLECARLQSDIDFFAIVDYLFQRMSCTPAVRAFCYTFFTEVKITIVAYIACECFPLRWDRTTLGAHSEVTMFLFLQSSVGPQGTRHVLF